MGQVRLLLALFCLNFLFACGEKYQESSSVKNAAPLHAAGFAQIQHIIFTLQENRPFDQYFGRLNAYRMQHGLPATADVESFASEVKIPGTDVSVLPYHSATVCSDESIYGYLPTTIDPKATHYVSYFNSIDLPYYYALVTAFATSDRWFSPVYANTAANRMFALAATSEGYVGVPPQPLAVLSIFDRLSAAGISWAYYYQNSDKPAIYYMFETAYRHPANIRPISEFFTELQAPSTLPAVVFIERYPGLDEHPGTNMQKGAAHMAKILNAFLSSPAYENSAFILSWDEGGFYYDHVPPVPRAQPAGLKPPYAANWAMSGQRLPLIVVSPFVKPHYVSHVVRDYTSWLAFVEKRFGIAPLTARDATADDMLEMFDFTQPMNPRPTNLPAPRTDGICDPDLDHAPGY